VPGTIEELLQQAGSKLNINAEKAFTEGGAQLDDVRLIRDDEKLYISSGEPFFKSTGTYKSMLACVLVYSMPISHISACACVRRYPRTPIQGRRHRLGRCRQELLGTLLPLVCVRDTESCRR